MKKLLSLAAIGFLAISVSACESVDADNSIYVEQWENQDGSAYTAQTRRSSRTNAYNDSLRK